LAIEGGRPLVREPIKTLRTIGEEEAIAVNNFMELVAEGRATLSGYLAGAERGGSAVQRLEQVWAAELGVRHAIACNSCTSAILAACVAADVRLGKKVIVPALGMSAAAAVPQFLGGEVEFADVDEFYTIAPRSLGDVMIAVSLFGHPAHLHELRSACDRAGTILIEDAAQSPFAMEGGQYAGTIGHIGCFSWNVHKPLNAGEGGMCVTNDAKLAARMRAFVNHGEVSGGLPGLNLRMPEIAAATALAQLPRGKRIVAERRSIADGISEAIGASAFELPTVRQGCLSSWYCYAFLAHSTKARDFSVKSLNAEGVPVRSGYTYIPALPAFQTGAATRAKDYESRMILLELCSIDPTDEQVGQIGDAIRQIGDLL
jgi:dTDP-4-amino-4,6-dideoxygalactose transaminase